MKRMGTIIVVAAVVVIVAGAAYAQMGRGGGPGAGPGAGCIYGTNYAGANGTVDVENVKKFQKETSALRDELMIKRAELRNEYAKPVADTTRIADIRKQMIDLQAKIQSAAQKNGLPAWGPGYGRGYGGGGMGRGMGAGPGGCPRRQ